MKNSAGLCWSPDDIREDKDFGTTVRLQQSNRQHTQWSHHNLSINKWSTMVTSSHRGC